MSVLEEIVARKRTDLALRRHKVPRTILEQGLAPSERSFAQVLAQRGPRFIFECKRASPSAGVLRASAEPAAIARAYAPFADAISVLTDAPYFGGSHTDLAAVRANVDQPILCKDFTLHPYQVVEARAHGADAVLLMLSVLDDRSWQDCAACAAELDMDVLTEVHDAGELARALRLEAPIIGINNRDLATLEVDLAVTERLAPQIPSDRLRVSESGIGSHADVCRLSSHADAFLVGSALMRQPRLELATRTLIHGRVKVCGLTAPEQARAAWNTGARFGGLIFVPGSPRCIEADTATAIARASPLPLVGVFADAPISRIAELTTALGLTAVQLHGREPREAVIALRAALPAKVEIWKAVAGDAPPASAAETGADRLLFDNGGGSGRPFDWTTITKHPERPQAILAGGLDAGNIRAAADLGFYALDVNSGVERAPGHKDTTRMHELFTRLAGRSES